MSGGQYMTKANIDRLMAVLSDILSDKYDAKITITAKPKSPEQVAS